MSEACQILHQRFASLTRLDANYSPHHIPKNGIYVLFEKNELAHGGDRIVRIGTHTGQDNLPKRLKEHLFTPNKDRSIFRKHIGRCLLNKNKDPFLQDWDISLTKRADRLRHADRIDAFKLEETERAVTDYMQQNFSFVVFEATQKEGRLELETSLIATIAQCRECHASDRWLGNYHPNEKIRRSGLWNIKGLSEVPISAIEAKTLKLH